MSQRRRMQRAAARAAYDARVESIRVRGAARTPSAALVQHFTESPADYFASITRGVCPYDATTLAPAPAELSDDCGEPMMACSTCKRLFGQPTTELA